LVVVSTTALGTCKRSVFDLEVTLGFQKSVYAIIMATEALEEKVQND
jgi:hypothetical protein